eukprot:7991887-Ditylum_brightwellii.AAC.1
MCKEDGTLLPSSKDEDEFHEQLIWVQTSHPNLINSATDDAELYGVFQSTHQGSFSRATYQGVPKELQDLQNCWQLVEHKQGNWARSVMRDHYLEILLLAKRHLGYSQAL